jgi:hypothetical protein
MYASDDEWDEFLLTDRNLCFKYANRRRRWIHKLWESRTYGGYFKLCKYWQNFPISSESITEWTFWTFDYILDRAKEDLQGYSNFRKCIEAEKHIVAFRYVLVIAVAMTRDYICKMLYAVTVQCNLKGKVRATLNWSKLSIYKRKQKHQATALTSLVEILQSGQLRVPKW